MEKMKKENGMNGMEEATLGSQTLTVATQQAVELLSASDEMIANGLIRAEKALKKHKKEVTKKGVNFLIALGVKGLTKTFVPDTIIDDAADVAVGITGVSAGLTVKKVINTAMSFKNEDIEAERRARILASIEADENEAIEDLDTTNAF